MNPLQSMRMFCCLVEARGFSAAAERLDMSHSTVSRQLKQLEASVGVQLVNRNTRRFALTAAGERYYQYSVDILARVEAMSLAMTDERQHLAGALRVSVPLAIGTLELQDWLPAFRERFPDIQGPRKDDICYATQNRQDAVKRLALEHDLVLVVGSPNSSNSNRLRELAERLGSRSYLIDGPEQINSEWVKDANAVAVTAGASAPENVVQAVCGRLRELGIDTVVQEDGVTEKIQFSLPKELKLRVVD